MEKYERFKKWLEQNKSKIVLGVCFILVFFFGFGTGNYNRENFSKRNQNNQTQNNYTTKTVQKPEKAIQEAIIQETIPVEQGTSTKVQGAVITTKEDCIIKGNISSGGSKIYHVKGGSFYERTKAEQCFNTEAEAVSAGFVKSKR